MELYIKISFWLGVIALIIRVLSLATCSWPRIRSESLGSYVAATILSLAFTLWAGIVLWIH